MKRALIGRYCLSGEHGSRCGLRGVCVEAHGHGPTRCSTVVPRRLPYTGYTSVAFGRLFDFLDRERRGNLL